MKSFIIAIAAAMPLYAQDAPAPAAEPQNPEQGAKCSCQCPRGDQQGQKRHHHRKASPFAQEAHKLVLAKYDKDGDGQLNDEEKAALQADAKSMMEQKKAAFIAKYDKDGDGKLSDEEKDAMKAEFQAKREQRRAEWAQKNPEKAAKREQKKAEFIAKHDKDGDGKLSDEEKEAMKAGFQAKREQRKQREQRGPKGPKGPKGPQGPQREGMFAQMVVGHALMIEKYDADKDGKLSPEELGDLAPKGERCGKGDKGRRGPKGRHGHHGHGPQAPAPAPQQ